MTEQQVDRKSIRNQSDLLFFTCATGYYENFVIPYIYFAEKANPNSKFEFIVSDADQFIEKNGKSLMWLDSNISVKPVIRNRDAVTVKPRLDNSIRFISQPMQVSNYVYIGDVDIMIFENILKWHKPIFDAELPYSNIIRKDSKRLTGLHLTNYDDYYPLPDIEDIVKDNINDEELLYKIVERKGKLYDTARYNALVRGRPTHGIHMSLNRLPFSAANERVGWGISYANAEDCEKILGTDEFKDFYSTLYNGAAQVVVNLIFLTRGICSYGKEFFVNTVRY